MGRSAKWRAETCERRGVRTSSCVSKWTILGNDGVAGSEREPTNEDEPAEDAAEAAEALLAAESGLVS